MGAAESETSAARNQDEKPARETSEKPAQNDVVSHVVSREENPQSKKRVTIGETSGYALSKAGKKGRGFSALVGLGFLLPANAKIYIVPRAKGDSMQVRWQWRNRGERKSQIKYICPLNPKRTRRRLTESERAQIVNYR